MESSRGYLLDTSVLLWTGYDYDRISPLAKLALADESVPLHLSIISIWEMQIKHALGKLPLNEPADRFALRCSERIHAGIVDFRLSHISALYGLPFVHRDPFDRMLVAQAISEGLTIVSPDPVLRHYPVRVLW
jgi:PIN domain nuclease of toxin-antitoxin system